MFVQKGSCTIKNLTLYILCPKYETEKRSGMNRFFFCAIFMQRFCNTTLVSDPYNLALLYSCNLIILYYYIFVHLHY